MAVMVTLQIYMIKANDFFAHIDGSGHCNYKTSRAGITTIAMTAANLLITLPITVKIDDNKKIFATTTTMSTLGVAAVLQRLKVGSPPRADDDTRNVK
jgi:hypothetical protein